MITRYKEDGRFAQWSTRIGKWTFYVTGFRHYAWFVHWNGIKNCGVCLGKYYVSVWKM